MNQPPAKPFDPANDKASASSAESLFRELAPLWIWLAVAVLTSFFSSPADPGSTLIFLAYGLLALVVGVIAGSGSHFLARLLILNVWTLAAYWFAVSLSDPKFTIVVASYGLLSAGLGIWAFRHIQHGHLRIIACFGTGFVIGSAIGPLGGTIAGATLGAILAKRSLRMSHATESG